MRAPAGQTTFPPDKPILLNEAWAGPERTERALGLSGPVSPDPPP